MATSDSVTSGRIARSMEMYERLLELIPGGTQLISRRPTRFALGVSPVVASHGKGARIWDVDGNEYIDWVSAIGSVILGYTDPVVDEAVRAQIQKGANFSITHELELELAELLVERIPCAEMVRYARGGGDACAVAVRIARGTTGRDKVLFCGYHGWHDWYQAANHGADENLDQHLFPGIEPIGVPKALAGTAIPFPYGDLEALARQLEQHVGEVAAIMMEPMRSDLPPEGYLEGVQQLARDHEVVLIFDEVSTGFRPSDAGVQPVLGVVPDMAVFAKSISNGYAMGAVVGSREVMEPAAQMFVSSTYWGETLGLAASLATLTELRQRDACATIAGVGSRLKERLNAVGEEVGLGVRCVGIDYHPHLEFPVEDPTLRNKVGTLYVQEMAKRGCHGYTSFYINAAQGEAEIEQTVDAAREVFTLIGEALDAGQVDERLEARERQEFFRRLVT
ncbi:MAG: aminotransferase class III-fold pyridoxal phosphate-dependent enzyme [Planctomycetaceae bacterium]